MRYRLDWSGVEIPGGRNFRVIDENGDVLGEFATVRVAAPGRLVNYSGGGVLEVDGVFALEDGQAEIRGASDDDREPTAEPADAPGRSA